MAAEEDVEVFVRTVEALESVRTDPVSQLLAALVEPSLQLA